MGRHGLQLWTGAKDLEGREPGIRWQTALGRAFTSDGSGAHGANLGDRRAAHCIATSIYQHLIGTLPILHGQENSYMSQIAHLFKLTGLSPSQKGPEPHVRDPGPVVVRSKLLPKNR